MWWNLLIGFILPWIAGYWYLREDLTVIVRIGPVAGLIAFAFNEIGYQSGWWSVTPSGAGILGILPYNFGIFPVLACALLFTLQKIAVRPVALIPLFSVLKTLLESILVVTGKVVYDNGWNLLWTYVSYLIACSLTYGAYRVVHKYSLISFKRRG
ncbi:hypothetical protein [Paenibacillus sp. NFR01]|uniref:hypothetical protein n=1 Tax=Paenibacillus sp. NFR01 TaxID=1566279 RepID=UPI0008AE1950|nr:hypothetical protein [Paenibacillus sp. NFR01]SET60393.1 hypothetical protein SAMN03159358_2155 [Paenibacillus sp. NFR01]